MTDDQPISKWRAAGQQHPGSPDQTRNDTGGQMKAAAGQLRQLRAAGQLPRDPRRDDLVHQLGTRPTATTSQTQWPRTWPRCP